MPIVPLSPKPNLERLKHIAKDLRDLVRAGVPGAIDTVREHHPRLALLTAGSDGATSFKLADAQLTLARHHGFSSWPVLVRFVESANAMTRSPHEQLGDGSAGDGDELIRLACMNYGNDSPGRVAAAATLLRSRPALSCASIFAAAASGDHQAMADFFDADVGAATRSGGPFDWPPLLYAVYSRLASDEPGGDFTAVVRMLLDGGADPNSGFLWDGQVPPFTALTGVIGRGEQGGPPHVQQLDVLQLLLDAGADPNDGQAVYNAGIGNAVPAL
jgi:hypothetical protein